jgi:hypothetical protein
MDSLRPTPDWNDPIRAGLAQRIIALAKAGERDAELLCDGALLVVSPAVSSLRPGRPGGRPSRRKLTGEKRLWPQPPSLRILARGRAES